MGRSLSRVLVGLLVLAMSAAIALADKSSGTVTIVDSVVVNGTVLKAGTYRANFDSKSNELSILQGKKLIAKVPAHVEQADHKTLSTEVLSAQKDNAQVLTGISFGGSNQTIVVGDSSTQTKAGSM